MRKGWRSARQGDPQERQGHSQHELLGAGHQIVPGVGCEPLQTGGPRGGQVEDEAGGRQTRGGHHGRGEAQEHMVWGKEATQAGKVQLPPVAAGKVQLSGCHAPAKSVWVSDGGIVGSLPACFNR